MIQSTSQHMLLLLSLLTATTQAFTIHHHHYTSSTTRLFQKKKRQQQSPLFASSISPGPLVNSIEASKTVEIFSLVKQLTSQGQTNITSLCVGEPDFDPPKAILDATRLALEEGKTRYTAVTGTAPLRSAICADLKRRKNLDCYTENHIIVANGAKQVVYQALLAICGTTTNASNDEKPIVLIPSPYWPSYPEMVKLVGARPVIVPTRADNDGYILEANVLKEYIERYSPDRIKMIILCNPSNPTGAVLDTKQLQALADVIPSNVAILSDEIYERLVYEGDGEAPSMASFLPNQTFVINGFSKAFAMTGYRLGYVACPTIELAQAVSKVQSQLTSCANSLSQEAGVAALTLVDDEEITNLVQQLNEKRNFVWKRLQQMMESQLLTLPATKPRGAFYILANISQYIESKQQEDEDEQEYDDVKFCVDLLQSHQLALVPGSAFGAPGTVRISYATSMEELEIAMNKLQAFLEQ